MKGVLINNGVVARIVRLTESSNWAPPQGFQFVQVPDDARVSPGWLYDGVNFTAPPPTQKEIDEAAKQAQETAFLTLERKLFEQRLVGDTPDPADVQIYRDGLATRKSARAIGSTSRSS